MHPNIPLEQPLRLPLRLPCREEAILIGQRTASANPVTLADAHALKHCDGWGLPFLALLP